MSWIASNYILFSVLRFLAGPLSKHMMALFFSAKMSDNIDARKEVISVYHLPLKVKKRKCWYEVVEDSSFRPSSANTAANVVYERYLFTRTTRTTVYPAPAQPIRFGSHSLTCRISLENPSSVFISFVWNFHHVSSFVLCAMRFSQ